MVELINRAGRRMGFSRVARLWEECFITEEHFSEPFFVLVQIAVALARLAEDLRLWMTAEFDFFELADEHASGSSGRPQKKNPFGLQSVINGAAIGAGRLAAQFATNITVSEEADTTYHAYTMYQFARDVATWTDFMADVVEKGDFKLAELERKSGARLRRRARGARRAGLRASRFRTGSRTAASASWCAWPKAAPTMRRWRRAARSRLPSYPIDADGLVRTMKGESKAHIMLNIKAFRAVHRRARRKPAQARCATSSPIRSRPRSRA